METCRAAAESMPVTPARWTWTYVHTSRAEVRETPPHKSELQQCSYAIISRETESGDTQREDLGLRNVVREKAKQLWDEIVEPSP
jgi:hypothetical protein